MRLPLLVVAQHLKIRCQFATLAARVGCDFGPFSIRSDQSERAKTTVRASTKGPERVNEAIAGQVGTLFAQATGGGAAGGSPFMQLLPFAAIAVLFWFLLIRPESKKRAEHAKLLDNLKKNDRVVTAGGLFGTVVNVQKGSEEVVLKVDENNNTRVRILRSAISRILTGGADSGNGSEGSGEGAKDSE